MRPVGWMGLAAITLCGCGGHTGGGNGSPPIPDTSEGALVPIGGGQLQVTEGKFTDGATLSVDTARFRAVTTPKSDADAELRFTFIAPTAEQIPLDSGDVMQDVALKLRAEDGCNVAYVSWRLDGPGGIYLRVKRNPNLHTFDDCGADGYINRRLVGASQLAPMKPGVERRLHARLQGKTLTLWADGYLAYQGDVDWVALDFDGPAGVSLDNARVDFRFYAALP